MLSYRKVHQLALTGLVALAIWGASVASADQTARAPSPSQHALTVLDNLIHHRYAIVWSQLDPIARGNGLDNPTYLKFYWERHFIGRYKGPGKPQVAHTDRCVAVLIPLRFVGRPTTGPGSVNLWIYFDHLKKINLIAVGDGAFAFPGGTRGGC